MTATPPPTSPSLPCLGNVPCIAPRATPATRARAGLHKRLDRLAISLPALPSCPKTTRLIQPTLFPPSTQFRVTPRALSQQAQGSFPSAVLERTRHETIAPRVYLGVGYPRRPIPSLPSQYNATQPKGLDKYVLSRRDRMCVYAYQVHSLARSLFTRLPSPRPACSLAIVYSAPGFGYPENQ